MIFNSIEFAIFLPVVFLIGIPIGLIGMYLTIFGAVVAFVLRPIFSSKNRADTEARP